MNKAEALRQITNKANEKAELEKRNKHRKYAEKIINGKCHLLATLGMSSARVKIRTKYSPSLVTDVLVEQGFEVIRSSKNGRPILTIKW